MFYIEACGVSLETYTINQSTTISSSYGVSPRHQSITAQYTFQQSSRHGGMMYAMHMFQSWMPPRVTGMPVSQASHLVLRAAVVNPRAVQIAGGVVAALW